MSVENGVWIMKGVDWKHPQCIHSVEELEDYVNEIGFLPLFGNEVVGFSAEEWTAPGIGGVEIRKGIPGSGAK